MKQFPYFIQKAFRTRNLHQKKDRRTTEFSLSEQIANYAPLLELQDKRQLLQVQVVGNCHPQTYQSMIVGVDFVKQWLLLDALAPINPYCPIIIGDRLIVSHQQQGQLLSFAGDLIDIISDRDQLVYAMSLPSEIAYKQRRFYPRLSTESVATGSQISIQLRSPLKTPWHCSLKNISAGGVRVAVPGKVIDQLSIGSTLPNTDIVIDNLKINTALRVKSFRHVRRPYEHTDLSLAFINIDIQDRIRLQNYISFYLNDEKSEATLAS